MHFTRKRLYKERAPEETIRIIRKILGDLGIFISENSVHHPASGTDACALYFGDEAFVGSGYATNGKGMTARYALASAYGEMMERLCSGFLPRGDRKKAWLEGRVGSFISPDEKTVQLKDLSPVAAEALRTLLDLTGDEWSGFISAYGDKETFCVPYHDIINDCMVDLPIDLFLMLCTSNGLCAGNSYREAFCQGLSEIFERASLAIIYGENPTLFRIPEEWFDGTEVMERLRLVERSGYSFTIFDGSMGRKYPVVGLRLSKDGRIMTDLGADPDPVVALERCLTELFQCIEEGKQDLRLTGSSCGVRSDWKLDTQKQWYYTQFIKAKTLNSGFRPDNLFDIPELYSENYFYNDSGMDDYDYYLALIHDLGYHVYVRDFSYLGFPVYQVFVPELSLGDYCGKLFLRRTEMYLDGQFGPRAGAQETYEAVIPIINKIEERQRAYYLERSHDE